MDQKIQPLHETWLKAIFSLFIICYKAGESYSPTQYERPLLLWTADGDGDVTHHSYQTFKKVQIMRKSVILTIAENSEVREGPKYLECIGHMIVQHYPMWQKLHLSGANG